MNKALLTKEVQQFISENLLADIPQLIFKGSPFADISIQELAVQISARRKAKNKLPKFYAEKKIIFPPNLNLEQTSSEVTAKYKASQIKGKLGIDITGGFGIDSYYLSKNFTKFYYCELNESLAKLVEHNFEVLEVSNVSIFAQNALEVLEKIEFKLDWIYADPSRRDDHGGKVFLLEDCLPNIPENLDLLFSKSTNILIKTSPLLDLTSGIRVLRHVKKIEILGINNEVKELLWYLEKDYTGKTRVSCHNFKDETIQYSFEGFMENGDITAEFSPPLHYLYEPNATIMKSQLFGLLAQNTKSFKLHLHSHLFTSETLVDFPGRKFKIIEVIEYSKKIFQKKKIKKANLTTRNFPYSVEQLRKNLKIADGGNLYLFFTTNLNNKKIVILTEQIFEDQ